MKVIRSFIPCLLCLFYRVKFGRGYTPEFKEIHVEEGGNFFINFELLCALNGSRTLHLTKLNKEVGFCNSNGNCSNMFSESKRYFFKMYNKSTVIMNIPRVLCGDSGRYSYEMYDLGKATCNDVFAIITVRERIPFCQTQLVNATDETCVLYNYYSARKKHDGNRERARLLVPMKSTDEDDISAGNRKEKSKPQQSSQTSRSNIRIKQIFSEMDVPDVCIVVKVNQEQQLQIYTSIDLTFHVESDNTVASFQCCYLNQSFHGTWLYDEYLDAFPLIYGGPSFVAVFGSSKKILGHIAPACSEESNGTFQALIIEKLILQIKSAYYVNIHAKDTGVLSSDASDTELFNCFDPIENPKSNTISSVSYNAMETRKSYGGSTLTPMIAKEKNEAIKNPMKALNVKILIVVMPTIACLFSVVTCLTRRRCEMFYPDQSESGNIRSIAMATRTFNGDAHEVTQTSRSSQTIGIQVDILSDACQVQSVSNNKPAVDTTVGTDANDSSGGSPARSDPESHLYCSVHDVEEKRSSLNSSDSPISSIYSSDSQCAACAFHKLKHQDVISNPYEEDGDSEVQYKDVTTLDSHLVESPTDELRTELNGNQELNGDRECIHGALPLDPENRSVSYDLNNAIQRHSPGFGKYHRQEPCNTDEARHHDDDLEMEQSEYMTLERDSSSGESCDASVGSVITDATRTQDATSSSGYDCLRRPAIEKLDVKIFS